MRNVMLAAISGVIVFLSGCAPKVPVFQPQEPSVIFDQARSLIEKYYVDSNGQGVTLDVSKRPDVGSLVAQLDPSAELLSWKKVVRFYNPFRAEIGVSVRADNGAVLITAVDPDASASHAGLRAGDRIVRIDGEPMAGRSWIAVIAALRGEPGSDVSVAVELPDGATKELRMTRTVMDPGHLVGERILETDLGYLRIGAFARTTAEQVKSAVKGLMRDGARGLIIDLKDNSDDADQNAANTIQLFIKEGIDIGRLNGRLPEFEKTYVSQGWTHYADIPLVVLVNKSTTAGGEMFAAAMHDGGRAVLVGQQTAGSGEIVSNLQLRDGSSLFIRTGYIKTGSGVPIEGHGILPDVTVDLSPAENDEMLRTIHSHRMWERGDVPFDRQLAAAVSVLRSRAMNAAQGVR